MLINIPKNISPNLLKILSEMGHGDEIVIADGNFPSAKLNNNMLRYDSTGIVPLLDSILKLFPLDTYSKCSVILMDTGEEYTGKPKIWNEYEKLLKKTRYEGEIHKISRFDFYERTKDAYAVIATGEVEIYANIILKKGVI